MAGILTEQFIIHPARLAVAFEHSPWLLSVQMKNSPGEDIFVRQLKQGSGQSSPGDEAACKKGRCKTHSKGSIR